MPIEEENKTVSDLVHAFRKRLETAHSTDEISDVFDLIRKEIERGIYSVNVVQRFLRTLKPKGYNLSETFINRLIQSYTEYRRIKRQIERGPKVDAKYPRSAIDATLSKKRRIEDKKRRFDEARLEKKEAAKL